MTDLDDLRRESLTCQACELHIEATQTVFGDGSARASLMLVGEQPGDAEDRLGEPFVGPAGRLLDGVLHEVGIPRPEIYLTNVVKHFRFELRGKRRIHQTPGVEHVRACLPWLVRELEVVQPRVVVTLGATAAKSMLGSGFRLTAHRGEVLRYEGRPLVATLHPSAVLRAPAGRRADSRTGLVEDLFLARELSNGGWPEPA